MRSEQPVLILISVALFRGGMDGKFDKDGTDSEMVAAGGLMQADNAKTTK